MWQGRQVVLGVTGGIAAYKCVHLARALTLHGARVDVVLSHGATNFVGAMTFEAVTRRAVHTSLWERSTALDHLALPTAADLVIIAPATAHFLARAALGLADDLLTTMALATACPVLIAPAMNDAMFSHPATSANLEALKARGWRVVGPAVGALAEGPSERPGRMEEPDVILAHAERVLRGTGSLQGKRIIVTAGPTREAIDPVRVVTNRSSGKMGHELAGAAWLRGADVVLISGPTQEAVPYGVDVVRVESTLDMREAVRSQLAGSDVLIMAAAPADFRPSVESGAKLPRQAGGLSLVLEPTEDILLSTLADRPPHLTTVGFALETGDAVTKGRAKLARKHLDLIVVNDALEPGAGFEVSTNAVTIIDAAGAETVVSLRSKTQVAEAILNAVERLRG